MARQLTMATQNSIKTLHDSGHSNRKIARLLGIHRETVGKYVSQEAEDVDSIPAKPDHRDLGEETSDASASNAASSGPKNCCEPFRQFILDQLERGLTGTRIHQDLRDDHGFTASYSSVRRFIQKLRKSKVVPVRRLETVAGEEAQIDFGTAAWVIDESTDGKNRRPWLFRIVLSHSRKAYSEVVWRQTTDNFIACIENAIHYFGGVPKRLVIDNLKAAVLRADWYDPEVHPKLQSFAKHYGTVILPTKPYKPEHKGKVEAGVKYAKENALKGRTFKSLAEQNEFLLNWEKSVADTRIHGTTKKQVGRLFEQSEREALLPLPPDRFPTFQEARRTVSRDGHVEVAKAYYSAPHEYVGRRLWVRWDTHLVRVFNDQWQQLCVHAKAEPGRFRTSNDHIPKEKFSVVERGTKAMLERIELIGEHTSRWAQAMTQARGVEGVRVLVGLKALSGKHSTEELETACRKALAHGALRLRALRELIKRNSNQEQQQFEFIEHHPVIRPLSDYSLESLHAFRKERHECDTT